MNFLFRLLLVLAGLLFAASLAVGAVLVIAIWGVRAVWAKLTGRPVAPFIVRVDPRGGFDRMYRRAGPGASAPGTGALRQRGASDVTDVEPK